MLALLNNNIIFVSQLTIKQMKTVNFYKAVSEYWIAEFPIKGERKLRRMPCGNTDEELKKAILRYEKKGYKVNIK